MKNSGLTAGFIQSDRFQAEEKHSLEYLIEKMTDLNGLYEALLRKINNLNMRGIRSATFF